MPEGRTGCATGGGVVTGENLADWNRRGRPGVLAALTAAPFDILVLGGGITGASILRDAALRGLRVALVDAGDFAGATSSRSSKLIHGGLRYLKHMGFRLARESCLERNLHMRLNKRLVRPMPFLIPLFLGRGEPRWKTRLGMLAYEALSSFANYRLHRFLSREQTLLRAPGLPQEGLQGGCLYYDAVVSDSRWTIEIVKDGVRHGGVALNHAAAVDFRRGADGRLTAAVVRDAIGGGEHEIRARAVINATGVFADRLRAVDDPGCRPLVRLSRGTHLVFAEEDVPLTMTTVFPSPIDGRPLFLAKHEGCFLYGTSDDWDGGAPDSPVPAEADLDYLFGSLRRFMPDAGLGPEHVRFAYSGFRPLLDPGGDAPAERASREDHVEESRSGLVTVVGGKMTTARLMAERVVDRLVARLGDDPRWAGCSTQRLSIGGTNEAVAEALARAARGYPRLFGYFRVLFRRYGLDAEAIAEDAAHIAQGGHRDPRAEPQLAELKYVCRHEMVCTVEDLIDRRAGFLAWSPDRRLERARYAASAIQALLGLDARAFEEQMATYAGRLRRFNTVPHAAAALAA